MKKIAVALSCRPDIIKLFPVIKQLAGDRAFNLMTYHARQHTHLADQVFEMLNMYPAVFSIDVPPHKLNLTGMFTWFMEFYKREFEQFVPDAVMVHGDVIGSLAAAMTAFFHRIPVFHVEAGLRTADYAYPFPEEGTRRIISKIAQLHFVPTIISYNNLRSENIAEAQIVKTGNTIVDAMQHIRTTAPLFQTQEITDKNVILITLHRRELWDGDLMQQYLLTLAEFNRTYNKYYIIFPVHPNPHIRKKIEAMQEKYPVIKQQIGFKEPYPYDRFLLLLDKYTSFVVTDSGGVLEEASVLGIPTLVMRKDTERPEAALIDPDYAKIIGDDLGLLRQSLVEYATVEKYATRKPNPLFGDGKAAAYIHNAIRNYFNIN